MTDLIRVAGVRSLVEGVLTLWIAGVAFLGWRATLLRHVDQQTALIESISEHGGRFTLDTDFLDTPAYGPPQWLRGLMGERYFSHIVSINLGATGITDENVKRLAKLRHLQSLGIWRTRTSDAVLAAVAHLKELETLDISQTDVTDDGLKQLSRLADTNIRALVVGGDRITDRGLEHLKGLSKLTMLCVVGDHFSAPAKKGLEQSLPDTTVIFVPLPQVAGGAPRGSDANPAEPAPKPQPPVPNQGPPAKKLPMPHGQFT
jgi:hypothetical protein